MTRQDYRNEFHAVDQIDSTSKDNFGQVLDLLIECGFDGMAQVMELLLNEAMQLERPPSAVLQALPYERTPSRRGYANGFKPKTVHTRVGELELAVPQADQQDFG